MLGTIDKPIDDEEAEIMKAVNDGNYRILSDEEARDVLEPAAKNITIRMQHEDLKGIKEMARAAGMPYQTLINSIIHRYVTGGIVFKVAV